MALWVRALGKMLGLYHNALEFAKSGKVVLLNTPNRDPPLYLHKEIVMPDFQPIKSEKHPAESNCPQQKLQIFNYFKNEVLSYLIFLVCLIGN